MPGKNIDIEKKELDILGMECVNCSNSIKSFLEKTSGIRSVAVNYTSETAVIEFNPDEINLETIKSHIRQLGYEVAEDTDEGSIEMSKKKNLLFQKYNLIVSAILTAIVMGISMSGHFHFISFLHFPEEISFSIQLIITSIVVFVCGKKFHTGAISVFRTFNATMDTTISMGTLAAYFFSFAISINLLLKLNIDVLNNVHEVYFETASMIITLVLFGNYLEAVLKSKTQTSINKLKGLQAKEVLVIRDNAEILIPFRKVRIGDIVVLKAGDKIPVEGEIIEGICVVDESAMTGESKPVEKIIGENLISGSILINGAVKIKAGNVGKDTMLSKVISLVKDASNSKPKIQRIADKVSAIFVPAVIIFAVLTFLYWFLIDGSSLSRSLIFSVSVLVVACPCALGLAAPMAVVIGIGRAAESGILFNNVEAIEKMNKLDTICFDKTGTLTSGEMKIIDVYAEKDFNKDEVLLYTASLEKHSNHPIAKSLSQFIAERNIKPFDDVENVVNEHGMGISGKVKGKEILIGNERMFSEKNIKINSIPDYKGITLFIGIDKSLAGIIVFEDELKSNALNTIERLRELNKEIFMISGDSEEVAKEIADKLKIEKYSFKTLPDGKEKIISGLQSEGKKVAMIGDGINDAPSLARADVGIAIGTGQDIALDTADVILVKGNLNNIIKAINISAKTVSIIKQNFFWAFFYNALAIPLAAGVLSPWGIYISPIMAAMFMAFSDIVTVMLNSLRLKTVNIK